MLLLYLIIIPFIGGLLCGLSQFFSFLNSKIPRFIAMLSTGLILLVSLQLWKNGNYSVVKASGIPQWQLSFCIPWIPRFGIDFNLALDGLSLLMLILTGFLGITAVLCSWNEIKKYQGLFYLNLMWIIGGVIGVLLSIDMFLFFFFWETILIPMCFLISFWGYNKSTIKIRINATTKFFIYTQISGLLMLAAIIGLACMYYKSNSIWTFNYEKLLKTPMSHNTEYMLMLGFFIAFAIKMPIVPFHGWLPDTQSQTSNSGSVDLVGILIKTAVYGMLRFTIPLFPHVLSEFSSIMMCLGIISIFYGAWIAFSQTDIKRLIAYSSISHMGFILIAIADHSELSMQGMVVQMISNSLSTAALVVLCGQLCMRTNTRDLSNMGGLWSKINWIPGISLFFIAANLGLPGTGNFVGECLILIGSFKTAPIVVTIATFGLVFSSIYSLVMIYRIYYGTSVFNDTLPKISLKEFVTIVILAILLILLGMYPQPIFDTAFIPINNIQKWLDISV
ncbi:NADH-quinone oxidoreductase subunit M [Candidatus Pantoea edessiphila]|uniref:NADH-quinone oxidoreductase subunit M n=1 Tax=Candidatus Pantoea edessiphila TaxID=2044610 RepID=A0A2P5SYJ7_9GAMM|nr:NADH-quinone oxidoreductase subunit M [Candidatus Pantoea edessiphila]MBK4775468.1 NADH-quinone oxidoreductase subunit M [Pantoea sp. Edef]PPI87405.1 NADH-quinone oxidoreductase subunit M [Candidatus Pantoea edessiphila]